MNFFIVPANTKLSPMLERIRISQAKHEADQRLAAAVILGILASGGLLVVRCMVWIAGEIFK